MIFGINYNTPEVAAESPVLLFSIKNVMLHGRDGNGKDPAWVQAIESAMEVLELISPYY